MLFVTSALAITLKPGRDGFLSSRASNATPYRG
jgi:hypothetical protein